MCISVFNATLNTRLTLSHLLKLCGKVYVMLSSPVHAHIALRKRTEFLTWHVRRSINILPPPDTYSGEGYWTWACRRCVFGTLNSVAVTWRRPFYLKVILVSSSRHPDQWIVPGGGMEPEEEPCGAAIREVYEEVSSSTEKIKTILSYTSCICSSTFSNLFFKACCMFFSLFLPPMEPLQFVIIQYENELSETCCNTNDNAGSRWA